MFYVSKFFQDEGLTPQSQINEWLVTVYNSLSAKTYLKKILCYIAEHLA